MLDILLPIFVVVDDFCKEFEPTWNAMLLETGAKKRNRFPALVLSEIMSILIAFHRDGSRNFKKYYERLLKYHKNDFPRLPSYNHFLEIRKAATIPLFAFFNWLKGDCTGVSFIDATAMAVCKLKRTHSHRVFAGKARLGKSTMGWFFGFKLHLVVNHLGHPLSFTITPGNTDDRSPVDRLAKGLWGKIFGDKGYISKDLFSRLFEDGLQLVTALKSNMKTKIMPVADSDNLKKRSGIESIFNVLKNVYHLEHSRHRSAVGFVINAVSCVCAFGIGFLPLFQDAQFTLKLCGV